LHAQYVRRALSGRFSEIPRSGQEALDMKVTGAIVVLAMAMACSRPALAQDEKLGLTMAYPTAVGVLWQVNDRVAVRPEVSWLHHWVDNDDDGFAASTSDSSDFGVGISALVRLRQWGQVRAYVAPRFEASRITIQTTYELRALFPPAPATRVSETTETTITTYEGGASIGVQAAPAPHFGVFGEVGMMYARGKTSSSSLLDSSSSATRSNSVGIRSAVGVILFF
jgi:hypothetical protein